MTPDQDLAARIADRLAEAGLIDPARRDDLAKKVAAGKATPQDWRAWVELRRDRADSAEESADAQA